ncbi:MAG: FHA domain-containing protein, partial [Bdellovibrionales bacterium]|nr:FHA domain-containing protein [Bdellovibrionales bacterium]
PYEFLFYKEGSLSDLSDNENDVDEFEKTMIGQVEYIPQIQFLKEDTLSQKTITLPLQENWIAGRDSSCEIQIDDQRVSRKQFQILKEGFDYFLIDLGSVNGTMLNNKNIVPNEKVLIQSGDKIQVLDNLMLFELKNPNFDKGLKELKESPVSADLGAMVPIGTQAPTVLSQTQQTQNSLVQYSSEQAPMPAAYGAPQELMQHQPYPYSYADQQANPFPPSSDEGEFEEELDDKKKKIRLVLIGVVVIVFGFILYDQVISPDQTKPTLKSTDPFAKVNPNELSLLKQSKEIANDYYYKKSYQLALDETQKILKKMEDLGVEYKKTKFGQEVEELDKKASLAIEAEKEIDEYNRRIEEQKRNEEKLLTVVNDCESKLNKNPDMSMEEYDSCISSVIYINPAHPKIVADKLKIQQRAEELAREKAEQKVYREKVARLAGIYHKAVNSEKSKNYIQAIEDYKTVLNQNLPDPQGLKSISRRKISEIEGMISSKSSTYIAEADKLVTEKKYKEAILRLRAAIKVNPIDNTLEQKIYSYKRILAKEIKPIWEEAAIEETYSQVECSENKSCAIEKWRRILEMDIPDGEYYHKAYTKLKKYGVQ